MTNGKDGGRHGTSELMSGAKPIGDRGLRRLLDIVRRGGIEERGRASVNISTDESQALLKIVNVLPSRSAYEHRLSSVGFRASRARGLQRRLPPRRPEIETRLGH